MAARIHPVWRLVPVLRNHQIPDELTPGRAANIRPEHHDESKTDHSG